MRHLLPGLCLLLAAFTSAPALAHASPDSRIPPEGAVVASPPEVRLAFSEAVEPAFSSLSLTDAHGKEIPAGKTVVEEPARKTLRLPLPALSPGVYIVNWVVVSVDGHRTKGQYRFTVK